MKNYLTWGLLCAVGFFIWSNHDQQAHAQAVAAPAWHWEYAQFSNFGDSYDFVPTGPRVHGDTLSALYTAMTGRKPVKHVADQSGDCTYVDIMNAAGADRWEVFSVTDDQYGKKILFKRVVQ